jgi:hypothetical protein
MEGQLIAANLIHSSKSKAFHGLTRRDLEKLLSYIKALELAFADLLRLNHEQSENAQPPKVS